MDVGIIVMAEFVLFLDDWLDALFDTAVQITVSQLVDSLTIIDFLIHTHAEMFDSGDISADFLVLLRPGILCDFSHLGGYIVIQMIQRLLLQLIVGV